MDKRPLSIMSPASTSVFTRAKRIMLRGPTKHDDCIGLKTVNGGVPASPQIKVDEKLGYRGKERSSLRIRMAVKNLRVRYH